MRDLINIIENADSSTNITIHKLEQLGLGKAPFRVTDVFSIPSSSMAAQNPEAYRAALAEIPKGIDAGICAMCGTAIKNNYVIKSADNHTHVVGSECINKINDSRLTTQAKEAKRKVALNKRREEQARKYEEYQRELDAQRERNNGLTDHEVYAKQREAEKAEKNAPIIDVLAPLIAQLEDGKGGFRDSIANDLRNIQIPRGRGRDIAVDILAKQAGRAGSKGYNNRREEIENILDSVAELING